MSSEEKSGEKGLPTGTMLRVAYSMIVEWQEQELASAGYKDVHIAHFPVLQLLYSQPQSVGARITDMAVWARMTKPAMIYLVDYLEKHGYVERMPDPVDGRAQRVLLSPKGHEAASLVSAASRQIEALWSQTLGEENIEHFKRTLQGIVSSIPLC